MLHPKYWQSALSDYHKALSIRMLGAPMTFLRCGPHHTPTPPIFQLGPIGPVLQCNLDERLPIFITGFVQIPPSDFSDPT